MLMSVFPWPDVVRSPLGRCSRCLALASRQLPLLPQPGVPPHPHAAGVV